MNDKPSKRLQTRRSRSAYALLMCLMVIAVSSSIVLTLFHALRLQTVEASARRQIALDSGLVDAAVEHAVAILLDQPSFTGMVGPFQVPNNLTARYTLTFIVNAGDVTVQILIQSGTSVQAIQRMFSATQIAQRRAAIGLN